MLYTPLQVGLPPARGAELATIQTFFVCYKMTEMSKILNLLSPLGFFQAQNAPKPVFGPRTPLGELTTLPRPPSRLGRGTPPPCSSPPRRLRCLDLAPLLLTEIYANAE